MEHFIHLLEIIAMPPGQAELKFAEEEIAKSKSIPGFSVMVLQIVLHESVSPPVRHLASILFKQAVDFQWIVDPGTENVTQIPDADKAIIRENAVQALLHCHPQVSKQLQEAIKTIIFNDWPKRWPDLMPRILDVLKTQQDPRMLEGALLCYWAVIKRSEWRERKRDDMYQTVQQTFPIILEFLAHIRNVNTPDSFNLQKIICKSFYACFQLKMPEFLRRDEVLGPWMTRLMEILMSPLPEGEPHDPVERASWAPWKAKKWTLHIFQRIFVRFADPLLSKKKSKKKWAAHFSKNYATNILQGVLQILELKRSGLYLPDQVTCGLLRFLSTSIRHSATWNLIAPYSLVLIRDIIFPMVCFSDEDLQVWTEDPQEYIRKEYDIFEEYHSPKASALDVLCTLAGTRSDETFSKIIDVISAVSVAYSTSPPDQRNPRQLEGALNMLGAISDKLVVHPYYSLHLDEYINQQLFPHLQSSNQCGFLVARAIWAFARYCQDISNPDLNIKGLSLCLPLLEHPELPTRVQAALSLRYLVELEEAKPMLQNVLPQIFETMFKLMNEVDNDDLVSSLDSIIFTFRHSIGPYAVAICERLTTELFRLAAGLDEDEDENVLMAASECGRTLVTVMSSIRKSPELFQPVFHTVLPFLKFAVTSNVEDFFDNALKVLAFVSYYMALPLPQELWEFVPAVVSPHDGFAFTYLEYLVPFLDNLITRDPKTFFQLRFNDVSFLEHLWKLLYFALDREGDELVGAEALKLVEVIFQNLRGDVDILVPVTLDLILKRLSNADDPKFRVLLFAVLGNVLFYNPHLALLQMEQRGVTQNLLGILLAEIENGKSITRLYDNKQVSLGLSSILQLPVSEVPPSLQPAIPKIVEVNILLLDRMNELILSKLQSDKSKKEAAGSSSASGSNPQASSSPFVPVHDIVGQYVSGVRDDDYEGEGDEDDEGDGVDDEINDDFDDDDDEAGGHDTLGSIVQKLQDYGQGYGIGADDDDDDSEYDPDSDDSDIEDFEGDSLSPIDNLDELAFFLTQLNTFVQREGMLGQQLMCGMNENLKGRLGQFEEEAKRREIKRQTNPGTFSG